MPLDDLLNTIIPWFVGLGMAGLFIYILREPLGKLWNALAGLIRWIRTRGQPPEEQYGIMMPEQRTIYYE